MKPPQTKRQSLKEELKEIVYKVYEDPSVADHKKYAQAILSAIELRLPPKQETRQLNHVQINLWAQGYNKCLRDIKQLLNGSDS